MNNEYKSWYKKIAFLLTGIVCFCVGALSQVELYSYANNFGDINGDGLINASDAALILMYSAYSGAGGNMSLSTWMDERETVIPTDSSSEQEKQSVPFTLLHEEWVYIPDTKPEYHDGFVCITSSVQEVWEVMQSKQPYLLDEEYDILHQYEELYDSSNIILVYSTSGASNRRITVDELIMQDESMMVSMTTIRSMFPTPDIGAMLFMIAVDKEYTLNVRDISLVNHSIMEE
ncbi:MAG: hypothetical protein K5695_04765 [Oscillospiraceae bacterium]|nr:hypothetical protein [Oscillospiraceae bacterium]